jgi:hypothetical protein
VNGYEILGRLWEAHDKLLGSYSDKYVTIDPKIFIKHSPDGYGLLARGPEPLIDAYKNSIENLMETKKVFSYVPRTRCVCLLFDNGFVIAESIIIEEK